MTENKDINEIHDDLETVADDHFEDTELEELEENSKETITRLKAKLKQSEKEKMEYLENLQRAKAEFLNARKRLEDEKMSDRERAVTGHIEKLLPLCDSFFMAMSDKAAWEGIDATWRKGIESIQNQLQSLLKSYGVEEVHPEGQTFDPTIHEALTNVPVTDEKKNDTVITVIQNGYTRNVHGSTQVIRPARVTVGEFKK